MIFTASRGQEFVEEFSFKNEKGQSLTVPYGEYVLTLERGDFVKEFKNLRVQRQSIHWIMTAADTLALEYSTLYFQLTYNGIQICRGVLRVQ